MEDFVFSKNIFLFIVISLLNTAVSMLLPEKVFFHAKWMFKERKWENGGTVYQKLFNIKKWKNKLPELSDVIQKNFPKKNLTSFNVEYLKKYIIESCRSEMCHWMIVISVIAFSFLFTEDMVKFILLLAVILNLPYIMIQRFNRPRIVNVMEKSTKKEKPQSTNEI